MPAGHELGRFTKKDIVMFESNTSHAIMQQKLSTNTMEPFQTKVLVVDDEPDILEFMQYNLEKEGFTVLVADNGKAALELAKEEDPNLIILDIMMPEMDGIETCRELRALPQFAETLIVFLTARNEDYSQIAGFDVGADDYINKPVRPRVLISRLKAMLRRLQKEGPDSTIQIENLVIDKDQYLVFKDGDPLKLARKEFELLLLLTSKPGKVFRREEILSRVWGGEVIVGNRTIDVHIRKLREKIGEDHISTVKGVGYRFG